MGRIRVLSADLANKIAAGEVVERPASVLKELVENAIDAGASRVDVELHGGGRDLVEVLDDGFGMGFSDARLCLERHATSKLSEADDLFAIRSLGFRGEALPSIAAVSNVEILTRQRDLDVGTVVRVEAGRIIEHAQAGAPAGTRVKVMDLFCNVPARRKFLRRPETELGYASETLVRVALAHPEIGFRLTHGSRTVFNSPGNSALSERVAAVVGSDVARSLYPLAGGAGPIAVTGLVGSPEVTRSSGRGVYIFVNRRFVRDRALNHAVMKAYGDLVDRRRSPVVVLFIEIAPDMVDVNVHPQKIEVRFQNGAAVYDAVASSVQNALNASPWLGGGVKTYSLEGQAGNRAAATKACETERAGPGESHDGYADHRSRVLQALERFRSSTTMAARPLAPRESQDPGTRRLLEPTAPSEGYFRSLRVIGQLAASYILCEGQSGLVVIDQHAAHERVAFERLRSAHRERGVPAQVLLVPRTLKLGLGQKEMLDESLEHLCSLGFDISSMGGGDVAVRSVPSLIAEADIERVLSDLIDELATLQREASFSSVVDRLLSTMACHSVVRAGQVLSRLECEALLSDLDSVDGKGSCPHGRPVAFTLALEEIERRFGRR